MASPNDSRPARRKKRELRWWEFSFVASFGALLLSALVKLGSAARREAFPEGHYVSLLEGVLLSLRQPLLPLYLGLTVLGLVIAFRRHAIGIVYAVQLGAFVAGTALMLFARDLGAPWGSVGDVAVDHEGVAGFALILASFLCALAAPLVALRTKAKPEVTEF